MDILDEICAELDQEGTPAPPPPKPFGKACGEAVRGLKNDFVHKGGIDKQVREQVDADLDRLIEKHESRKW